MTESKKRRLLGALLGIAALAGLGALVWNVSAYYVGTHFARGTYRATFPLALVVAVLAVIVVVVISVAVARDLRAEAGAYRTSEEDAQTLRRKAVTPMVVAAAAALVGIALVAVSIKPMSRTGYNVGNDYGAGVELTDGERPSYENRTNLPQARLDLSRNLGENRGQLGELTYVANAPTPGWCAPLYAGAALGRKWTKAIACRAEDTGKVTVVEFPAETVGAPDGAWSSKLGDQVAEVDRGSVFATGDIYGYLDKGDKPNLVVPITKVSGPWTHRHEVPAGVVVFGPDGTPRLERNVEPGQVPGPVMAMSIAEEVRRGLNARNGVVDFKRPERNPGAYQPTANAGDLKVADPNADNPTEFVLTRDDGRVVYVTPLTPFGGSGNVTAYLEVAADTVTADELPAAMLHRLSRPEASTQTIAQTIASLYDADLDWAEANEGGDASNKARIFELTPTDSGRTQAVIGVGNRSLYRVVFAPAVSETGSFGEICVLTYDTGEEIRCDRADSPPVAVGGLRGIASANPTAPVSPVDPAAPSTPLSGVPTSELIAELNRRAESGQL